MVGIYILLMKGWVRKDNNKMNYVNVMYMLMNELLIVITMIYGNYCGGSM